MLSSDATWAPRTRFFADAHVKGAAKCFTNIHRGCIYLKFLNRAVTAVTPARRARDRMRFGRRWRAGRAQSEQHSIDRSIPGIITHGCFSTMPGAGPGARHRPVRGATAPPPHLAAAYPCKPANHIENRSNDS